jgi:hypothetical protein
VLGSYKLIIKYKKDILSFDRERERERERVVDRTRHNSLILLQK